MLIQGAPRPRAGLRSPALPPPCFLSPPQRSFLSHLVFPQLRHMAGRQLPERSWQSHAERAFSKVLFRVLLCLLLPALKSFRGKHMLWGNYSIQFLRRKRSPKDKALLTTRKKRAQRPTKPVLCTPAKPMDLLLETRPSSENRPASDLFIPYIKI